MIEDTRPIRLVMELRAKGIRDTRVLGAIERLPRHEFVLPNFQDRAWADTALPIEDGQTISQPFVVAFMTQALELGPRMRVLEIGTGSGYQAAVLAGLCRWVYSVEQSRTLRGQAEAKFKKLGITNVVTRLGDGREGWPELAPFERIIITAAAQETPAFLSEQLHEGGIAVAPIGGPLEQQIFRFERTADGLSSEAMLPVRFVPLIEPKRPTK